MDATEKITSAQQLFEIAGEHSNLWSMCDEGIAGSHAYRPVNELIRPRNNGAYSEGIPDEFYVAVPDVSADVRLYLSQKEISYYDFCIFQSRIMNAEVINNANFWVFREVYRHTRGLYKIPSFVSTLNDMGVVNPMYDLHFPHTSLEDPTMVAYTPSYEYGIRDRQVRLKVGRYLQKYYGEVLSEEQIRTLANEAKGYEVQWAKSVEDIREVYRVGPSSCMSGGWRDEGISGDVTPIDVYAGEFSLGYYKNSAGKIIARGLVHEPTKTWVRTYGDEGTTLAEAFNALGYTHSHDWVGAKLNVVIDRDGRTLLPYLDGDAKGVKRVGSKWEICESGDDYEYWCDFTNGVADNEPYTCDCCGRTYANQDDMHYSGYAEQTFGPCCEDDFTWARVGKRETDYVPNDYTVYNNSNSEYYSQEYADYVGLVCDYAGDYWDSDDVVELMDGEYAHADDVISVGESEYGDPQYITCSRHIYTKEFIIVMNRSDHFPYTLWHEDFVTEEMHAEMAAQKYITTDFGVSVPEKYITIDQLVMGYGAEEATDILTRIGFSRYRAKQIAEDAWQAQAVLRAA